MKTTNPALTVQQRLAAGFGLILVILVTLSVIGLFEVRQIRQALEENASKNSVIQRYAINFRGSAHDRAIAVRDVAASTSDEELRKEIAEIERLAAFYADSGRPLDLLLQQDTSLPADVGRLYTNIKGVEARVLPLIGKVIELRRAGQREEAQQIVWRDAKPLFVEWLASINALIDFEERIIQEQLALANRVSGRFTTVMLGLTAVAVLVGALAAWLIAGSIRRALGAEPWQVKAVADAVRGGDLASDIHTDGADPASVIVAMRGMRDSLVTVVQGVRVSAQRVAVSATEIDRGNGDLSARTESQASALEETAASMEELGSTVKQNADNARQAN